MDAPFVEKQSVGLQCKAEAIGDLLRQSDSTARTTKTLICIWNEQSGWIRCAGRFFGGDRFFEFALTTGVNLSHFDRGRPTEAQQGGNPMRNNLRIHLLTAAFAAFSCTATAEVPGPAAAQEVLADTEGAQYIEVLIRAIDAADQIVVIEHSDYYDAYGSDTGWLVLDQQILYAKKDLNKEQIAAFRSGISALNPTTQNMFSSCTFESHHTITFFRSGEPQSVMRICFKCAEVEWSATSLTPPWSLYGGLGAFVSSMGMQPDRDWRALAMERIK